MIKDKNYSSLSNVKLQKRSTLVVFGKILLQINAKLGKPLWTVPYFHQFWHNKRVMYGAIHITKFISNSKNPSNSRLNFVISFVGTTSTDFTQTFCNNAIIKDEK